MGRNQSKTHSLDNLFYRPALKLNCHICILLSFTCMIFMVNNHKSIFKQPVWWYKGLSDYISVSCLESRDIAKWWKYMRGESGMLAAS